MPANDQDTSAGTHTEHEDYPWEINIPDHPARQDSPEYVKSRATMNATAKTVDGFYYGPPPYQDHHGGGLWLKDADGWFMVRNLAGMEWSSQFCADPAKVDALRVNARRLYAAFPDAVDELGIRDLLDHEITTADDVAAWTDSICNASVPLPAPKHTGVLPKAGGLHHYPAPIAEIDFFKFGSFTLWVVDPEGQPAAVLPMGQPGSGDGRVRLVYSTPNTQLNLQHQQAHLAGQELVFDSDHPLARQAFQKQYHDIEVAKKAAPSK